MISAVSITGGHLGAGLGVVELTVALHYVFDTPRDRLIWDVGHQVYPHKILTGRRRPHPHAPSARGPVRVHKARRERIRSRSAPATRRPPSPQLWAWRWRETFPEVHNVIAVIGDGSMSAGMAYEAMNNAGAMDSRLIVVLNDNDMSIAPPVGALSAYLSRLLSGKTYQGLARKRQADRPEDAPDDLRARAARGRIDPRILHRRHFVRAARLLLRRADRRTQSEPPAPGPGEREGIPNSDRSWSMSSRARGRVTAPRKRPRTSCMASTPSTS